jgi:basic membrane protein A
MSMTRRIRWSASLVVLALAAAACGGGNPAETGQGGGDGAGEEATSAALAFDVGGLGDESFNDSAYSGLQEAIDRGFVVEEDTDYIEPNATGSNADDNVVNLAEQGYDLVFGVGGVTFSAPIEEISRDFPDVDFAVVDGFACLETPCDNVVNLTFKEEQGSFLVGAAAALKSETGTIGFLGGQRGTGLIEKFEAGFTAGAKAVNPDIEVLVEYIGDTVAAYTDPTRGEALSAKMYDAGADVIYHASGNSGAGLFRAAVAARKLAIGVDKDQSLTASPAQRRYILTSMIKRVDTSVFETIQRVSGDNFKPGTEVFDLAEEGVGYAVNEYNDNERLLSKDIQAQLEDYKEQIIAGDIKVPTEP